jgi:hypothetical protein
MKPDSYQIQNLLANSTLPPNIDSLDPTVGAFIASFEFFATTVATI